MTTLTRAQLAALTTLHRDGEAWGQGRGIGVPGARQGTLNVLRAAGLATFARSTEPGQRGTDARHFAPAARTWADGFGTWHVVLPDGLDDPAAVARAIIRGEVAQRAGGVPRWRLDVFPVGHGEWTER